MVNPVLNKEGNTTLRCLIKGGTLIDFQQFFPPQAFIKTYVTFYQFWQNSVQGSISFLTKFCLKDKTSLQCTHKLIECFLSEKQFTNSLKDSHQPPPPTPCLLRLSLVLGTCEYLGGGEPTTAAFTWLCFHCW